MRDIHYPEMNEESRIARFWYMRNQMFFDHGFDRNERVLPVQYERLVTDPHVEFQRVFDFIGIPYSPRISRYVSARSVRKEGSPPVDSRVRELCEELLDKLNTYTEAHLSLNESSVGQVA
jgi:hypothetical protein